MAIKKTVADKKKTMSVKKSTRKTAVKAAPVKSKRKTAVKPPVKRAVAKASVKTAKVVKPVKKTAKSSKAASRPAGMPEQILATILRVLDDRQAEQIVTIELRGRSSMADYLVIASGRAARQIAAIAEMIRAELGKFGIKQVRSEGSGEANWVLVDAGDVIVHLFRPEVRQFYNIEQIYES